MLFNLTTTYIGALFFLLHCLLLGSALLKALSFSLTTPEPQSNWFLRCFFAVTTGMFINISVIFFLGAVGLLTPSLIYSSAAVLVIVAVLSHRKDPAYIHQFLPAKTHSSTASTLFLALFFTFTLIVSLHPPGLWDDTMYHLPLARHYLEQHSLTLNEYVRFPLVPQNVNLLIALGLLLGGDIMAQAFATLPLVVMAVGLLGILQRTTNTAFWGIIAIISLVLLRPIKSTLGFAYIDNGLALFCWGATLAVVCWVDDKQRHFSWLVIAGLLIGAAIGSKYFGLVLGAILGCCILVVSRSLKSTFIFGVIALLTGSWWYIRSYLISGDPIHPVGGGYFGYFLWDAADFLSQAEEQASHGVAHNPLNLLSALQKAGVIIWVFAFISLIMRSVPAYIRIFQAAFIFYFCFWFFVSQVDRYLAPIFGAGTLLAIYTLFRLKEFIVTHPIFTKYASSKWAQPAAGMYLLIIFFFILVAYGIHRSSKKLIHWNVSLEQRPGYLLYSEANKLIPIYGEKLVQLGFENGIYFFQGTAIGDWFGVGRYRAMIHCPEGHCTPLPADEMAHYIEGFSSRMLIISLKRYPNFDPESYTKHFKLLKRTHEGVLLGLLPTNTEPKK